MEFELPWTEKYRPKTLDEVIGQKEIVERMKAYVKAMNLPHLLFAGPPGTGKTTVTLALAHELFKERYRESLCELNASDERGIEVVRGKIKDFARTLPLTDVPFKLIFLDESDALTPEAQNALRRTMEMFSGVTRFILSCVGPETRILLPGEIEMTAAEFERKFNYGALSVKDKNLSVEDDVVLCYMQQNPKVLSKKTFRITTMAGRSLDVTEDHPILTENGWTNAGKLKVGDRVVVFPYLEGTGLPASDSVIISEENVKERMQKYEIEHCKFSRLWYENLPHAEKEKIEQRVLELNSMLGGGLTVQEKRIYDTIARWRLISRADISKKIGLSRGGVNYHLPSLVRKGWVRRVVDKKNYKVHRFVIEREGGYQLRNKMDINHAIEREFKVRISYTTIGNIINDKRNYRYGVGLVISDLKDKGLLPLRYSDKRIGVIARLLGFILGDGHITRNHQRLIFTTDRESLIEIRKDIADLGYKPSEIFSKTMENEIRGRKFSGTTTWFHVDSKPLCWFFRSLGVVTGDRCVQEFYVPEWIMSGPRYVKREFLRGLFGSEMHTPKCKKRNFEAALFIQHKSVGLVESERVSAEQIITLLKEFGVQSTLKIRKLGEECRRKSGEEMCEISIMITPNNQNFFDFLRQVGYAYSVEKEKIGRWAAEYLRHKLHVIEIRKELASEVMVAVESGHSPASIARRYRCTLDFVADRTEGKEVHLHRSFPTFEEWKSTYVVNNSEFVLNEIESIEEIELNDVRDIMCMNNHSFIANGIVSHNCNYSSKVIEPIQSRCSVFRFRPLSEHDIRHMLSRIAKNEKLELSEDAIKAIIYISEGDMRKAINSLQGAATLSKHISQDTIFKVSSRAKPEEIKKMIELALKGNFLEARGKLDQLMLEYGMSGEDVLLQVYKEITTLDIPDRTKVVLVDRIGEYNFRLVEGANERIQLEALLAQIMLIGGEREK